MNIILNDIDADNLADKEKKHFSAYNEYLLSEQIEFEKLFSVATEKPIEKPDT